MKVLVHQFTFSLTILACTDVNEYFKRKFTRFQGIPKTQYGKIKHVTDEYKKVAYRQLGPRESKLALKVTNNLLFLTVSKPMRIN